MATKIKTKYPVGRELKSTVLMEGRLHSQQHKTVPKTVFEIHEDLTPEAKQDLIAAIDEVLAFHKK